MATKIIPYNGLSSLLTLYIVLTRDDDGYILDSSDMTYKAPATVGIAPANALTEREIDGVKTQVYEFTDSTAVWNDGTYRFRIYEQAGGAAAINTDRIFASGTLILRGDTIVERSYSFGGEIDSVPVDVEDVVQTAANDIIAALGTVVNSSFEGTATDGTNTTIEDTTAAWDTDIWASTEDIETLVIVESAATGVRYVVKIVSNTSNTLTVDALAAGYVVVAGDTYTIIKNSSAVDIKSVGGTAQTGGDWTTQFSDIETDIEATNTALGTVNTNLGTLEDDVEVMTATTPTIYNISIAVADTEYSQALPANTKRFALSIIDGTPGENFRWAYETGKVATPTAPYRQLDQAFEYECDKINSSASIYIAASDVCTAQLEVWS